jgi:hypothetical protein
MIKTGTLQTLPTVGERPMTATATIPKNPGDLPLQTVHGPDQNGILNEVHVIKWVDYTSKYGMAYILSDGSSGLHFNDNTKIVQDNKGIRLDYAEKKDKEAGGKEEVMSYRVSDYPKELQKKVALVQQFKQYLDSQISHPDVFFFRTAQTHHRLDSRGLPTADRDRT